MKLSGKRTEKWTAFWILYCATEDSEGRTKDRKGEIHKVYVRPFSYSVGTLSPVQSKFPDRRAPREKRLMTERLPTVDLREKKFDL